MSQGDWISLSAAYKLAVKYFESSSTAELKIIDAMRRQSIRMNGEYYIGDKYHPETKLAPDYAFTKGSMIWHENRIEHKISSWNEALGAPNYLHLGNFHRVQLSAADIESIWPGLFVESPVENKEMVDQPPKPPVKGKGGVLPTYDWEKYLIEAAAFIYENSTKKGEAAVFRHLWNKFGGKDAGPSRSQMQTHITPLIRRLKEIDDG
ncbi:hypothetical protein [Methylobacterium longum]|uniref:Uncharacterized protein n=1 Tax=Methylobacterium longum TaxID=767694 RepID=A0ABT8ANW3_9HYPH|nr:hypothetical protein [Methylobacterium longum]MDN3571455.1 hypothetical protein [Methylobacterium longum]GJE12566.1 hypothetical protein FOHLNKBM_3616 [Methylobacterium longum]